MNAEGNEAMTHLTHEMRQKIETSSLIQEEAWQSRMRVLLEQWQVSSLDQSAQDTLIRALLLSAWELHPLPPRLERQLAGLTPSNAFEEALKKASSQLPHRLVEDHWNLVRKAAGRYHIPTQADNEAEFQELLSVGREALFVAAQKFYRKPRGSFKNFAWTILREKMRDEQSRRHPVPPRIRKKLAALTQLRENARIADKVLDEAGIMSALRLNPLELKELLQTEAVWGAGHEFETDVELEELEAEDHSLDQLSLLLEIEDGLRLDLAINKMTGPEKLVITKLYFEEKSLREVAEELELSLPALKKLHKRALVEMRQYLDDEDVSH